jgi:hypothetical protein
MFSRSIFGKTPNAMPATAMYHVKQRHYFHRNWSSQLQSNTAGKLFLQHKQYTLPYLLSLPPFWPPCLLFLMDTERTVSSRPLYTASFPNPSPSYFMRLNSVGHIRVPQSRCKSRPAVQHLCLVISALRSVGGCFYYLHRTEAHRSSGQSSCGCQTASLSPHPVKTYAV